jgi:hypothetical protein
MAMIMADYNKGENVSMTTKVMPLHFVTVQFRLHAKGENSKAKVTAGEHRFLYGVESWIEGVDQQLESLPEGETLELLLEAEVARVVARNLQGALEFTGTDEPLVLELRVLKVVKAEPREVVKALSASVHCCDHCGGH